MTGLPGDERAGDRVGCLDDQPLRRCRPAGSRASGHLEVVASVVAESGADQPFERARVGGGRAHSRRAAAVGSERPADACEVASRLVGPVRREAVPGVAGEVREADQRPLGESAERATRRRSMPDRAPGVRGVSRPSRQGDRS